MIVISEQKIGKKSIYHVKRYDSQGCEIEHKIYDASVCKIKNTDISGTKNPEIPVERNLVIVLDNDGNVRYEPYVYLNERRWAKPAETTRMRMGYALQSIYLWCDMHGKTIEGMNGTDVEEYIQFLLGINVESYRKDRDEVTYRTPEVVQGILGMIRVFLKEMKIDNEYILSTEGRSDKMKTLITKTHIGRTGGQVRVSTIRTVRRTTGARHFDPDQIRTLLEMAVKMKDKVSMCFLRLGVGIGIRGGSYASLTLEDIKIQNGPENTRYFIKLRNRVDDKDFCKGLYHPNNKKEYNSKLYKESYQEITITKNVYDFILKYYEASRNPRLHTKKELKEIYANTETASVEDEKKKNYYIWLNDRNGRLTLQTLNNHLKKLMLACGFEIDKGCRKDGVSHKIGRHTFAMLNSTYGKKKASPTEIRDLLGHASITSGEPYFTPTDQELHKLSEAFEQQIDELIFNHHGKTA